MSTDTSRARSKSPADLRRFRELMDTARRLMNSNQANKAGAYYQQAMAMVLTKKVYFVEA